MLSKLFLLPEGATVSFRGCIKQPSSRLDACSKSRKNGCFFSMRERHQLTIQPVFLHLLVVSFSAFQRYSVPRIQRGESSPSFRLFSNYKYPFSFKLTYLPVWETIKWSKTSIPIIFPASANRFVTSMSSILGVGSPDGWKSTSS